MSGGSMDYFCYSLDRYSDDLKDLELIELAKDFAKVFHAREWYDSGDYSEGELNKTVYDFKQKWFKTRAVKKPITCNDCENWTASESSNYGECSKMTKCLYHGWNSACDKYEQRKVII